MLLLQSGLAVGQIAQLPSVNDSSWHKNAIPDIHTPGFSKYYNQVQEALTGQLGEKIMGGLGLGNKQTNYSGQFTPQGSILLSSEKMQPVNTSSILPVLTSLDASAGIHLWKLPLLIDADPVLMNNQYAPALSSYNLQFDYESFLKEKKQELKSRLAQYQLLALTKMIPDLHASIDSLSVLESIQKKYATFFHPDSMLKYQRLQDRAQKLASREVDSILSMDPRWCSYDSLSKALVAIKRRYDQLMIIRGKVVNGVNGAKAQLQKADTLMKRFDAASTVSELKKISKGAGIGNLDSLLGKGNALQVTDFGLGPFFINGDRNIIMPRQATGIHTEANKGSGEWAIQAGVFRDFPFSLFTGFAPNPNLLSGFKRRFGLIDFKYGEEEQSYLGFSVAGFQFRPDSSSGTQGRTNLIGEMKAGESISNHLFLSGKAAKSYLFFPTGNQGSAEEADPYSATGFFKTAFGEIHLKTRLDAMHTAFGVSACSAGPYYYSLGNENFQRGTRSILVNHRTALLGNKLIITDEGSREIRTQTLDGLLPEYSDWRLTSSVKASLGKAWSIQALYKTQQRIYKLDTSASYLNMQYLQVMVLYQHSLGRTTHLLSSFSFSRLNQLFRNNEFSSEQHQTLLSWLITVQSRVLLLSLTYQRQMTATAVSPAASNLVSGQGSWKWKTFTFTQGLNYVYTPAPGLTLFNWTNMLGWQMDKHFLLTGKISLLFQHNTEVIGVPGFNTAFSITAQYTF